MNIQTQAGGRQILAGRRLKGSVSAVLRAEGRDFVSQPVETLTLTYEGIAGDFHAGLTRKSGGREPWYTRGTVMRNERQVSILSVEELAHTADNMGLTKVEAGWIGGNLVLEGIADLSFLPSRTLLMFPSGAVLRVDGYNAPCRLAGGSIAKHVGSRRVNGETAEQSTGFDWTRTDIALAFKEAAYMKRGLVAWVEREGEIRAGDAVNVRVWEQWLY